MDEKSKKLIDNVVREDDILNENITSQTFPSPHTVLLAEWAYSRY